MTAAKSAPDSSLKPTATEYARDIWDVKPEKVAATAGATRPDPECGP